MHKNEQAKIHTGQKHVLSRLNHIIPR